jgi:chromosome segregation protein
LRIKKLEIFGFKSFKDRTVIQFDEGITGVVGPNGCGKSNIVDALVWVMGEMSAKHLRGSSMEDVIFAGAEGYAPMGMAEVSLTLENDGGPFPAAYARFSEVMVTRRLNRSGESEYFVNKEPARLRDIQEIFMDTGAGSKGFSIIEQGAIGKIITSKPEDRRVLIEEAAGITKFKVRKRESQRKLESTEQNLIRLQDIIGEQKRQIDSLERQAQRAERYRKIKNELQEKDLWLASHQYLAMRDESALAENTFNEARETDAGSEGRVAALEARIAALRLEQTEKEGQVQAAQALHTQLVRQVQESEFRIRELNTAIQQAQRSNDVTGSLLSQYTLRRENLESEKERLESALLDAREESTRLELEFELKNREFTELQARVQAADQEVTIKRREMLAVSASASHLETREGVLKARIEDEERKRMQSLTLQDEMGAKKADFQERRNRLFSELERERQMHLDHTRDVDLIHENLQGLKTSVANRREELDTLKDELNSTASRLYGLENLQSNFEGFEEGVKNVLMWQRTRTEVSVDGRVSETEAKFQPLSEVVEVPERFELAMEASLGTRLQLLLSQSNDQTMGAVDYLKSQKSGRSSFLSVDSVGSADSLLNDEESLKSEAGVESFLKDVVAVPEGLRSQVAHFFADVVIVDSIRSALRLRSRYPRRTFVTLEGDTLTADGVLTGGASESADSGVLKRRREIKELSLKREELSGKVQLAQLTLQKMAEQEAGVAKQLEDGKKSAVEKEIFVAGLRKDLERAEIELGNANAAYEREVRNLAQVEGDLEKSRTALAELTSQLEGFRAQRAELEARVNDLTLELEQSRVGIDDRNRAVTDLRVSAASKRQELEGLERQAMLVQNTLRDVLAELARMSEESERNTHTLTSSQVEVESLQTELQRSIHASQEAELAVGRVRNEFEGIYTVVRQAEEELSKTLHDLNAIRARMNEAQLRLEQLKMKETYLIDQVTERYMRDLREVAPTLRDVPGDITQYGKDVEDLRDKLKRIGEVNLSAIHEYDEVIKRYEFLSQQHTDLTEAKEHLRKVIDRINRICSRRFKETFDQVNERFQKVFPVLFGGGEALLSLVEGKDGDDPGIDIMAKPPGKKLQNVTLLSGGEKALTAVSLIFSIFLVKPSPFCLLDEVDAPLDDANVMRFNDLVREMAKRSQIIIVTHNKHTMKVNNKLYGVTMQEKGVSKMVSVSLADAERLAHA